MVADWIFSAAGRTPAKPALVWNGRAISYAEFSRLIEAAAGHFHSMGLRRGVAVLALGSLLDFWVASLGLRLIGVTAMAASSVANLAECGLEDVVAVVVNPTLPWRGLDSLAEARGWRLAPMPDRSPVARRRDWRAAQDPGGQILQTSGTTGRYKKVLMAPSFETAFMRRRVEDYGIVGDSVVGLLDFGGWTGAGYKGAASAWLAGATVDIRQRRHQTQALKAPGLSHLLATPMLLSRLLAEPEDAYGVNPGLTLFAGAGPITQAQLDGASRRITPRVVNTVGSTETSTFCYTPLETLEDRRWHRPVPGRGLELVDERGHPVPVGETGRLRVIADGPQGYLGDEAATRAFFREGRFYPGDLGVARADGRIALQGRVTDVINFMGGKIAPAEIEDHLIERLGVSGACVFSMQDDNAEEEVHVVLETAAPIEPLRLADAVRSALRGFPRAHVHHLAILPRNAMGKLDRPAARRQVLRSKGLVP